MTHTLTVAYSIDGASIPLSVPIVSEGGQPTDLTVPASTTNLLAQLNVTLAQMQLLFVSSDQDITIKTNSSSSPTDTLTIKAGKPLLWYTGCGLANPITGNVTGNIYVTNATASSATVKIRTGYDATP